MQLSPSDRTIFDIIVYTIQQNYITPWKLHKRDDVAQIYRDISVFLGTVRMSKIVHASIRQAGVKDADGHKIPNMQSLYVNLSLDGVKYYTILGLRTKK